MLKKGRLNNAGSVIHLVFCVLTVSFSIYVWKCCGCFGYPECYLCRTFSPDYFLKRPFIEHTTTDFSRLMNLNNFSFVINNLVCNNSDLILMILVHSNPNHFEHRDTIRTTWGKVFSEKFRLLFLLGISNSSTLQEQIYEENKKNKDLVQGNFLDTYRNLTYKHVMALKWTKYYCPNVKYLLKTDDDIFVNSPRFIEYVAEEVTLPKTKLMRCLPLYDGRAQRTSRSKWKVSFSEYQFRVYPPYCQGFAILYSLDVVVTLYEKAQVADYFWIDDVFITGFLAMSVDFKPSSFGRFILEPTQLRKVLTQESDVFSYLIGPFNMNVIDIKKLWEIARTRKFIPEVES